MESGEASEATVIVVVGAGIDLYLETPGRSHGGRAEALTPQEFDLVVERAFAKIPARFRNRMKNVALVVEAEPPRATRGGELLGLYQGRPLTQRSVFEGFTMPDRITIFQGPHERLARNAEHLEKLVSDTVWHEIAHYFGMDERQVRAAERRRLTGRPRRPPA